ncbi:MAG: hypothetical protein AMXMBFR47_26960 [Planctomycetota bacterium]
MLAYLAVLLAVTLQEAPASQPASQPATAPASTRPAAGGRSPEQARIFEELLRETDRFPNRPRPVVQTDAAARAPRNLNLSPEGLQQEKAVRLVKTGERFEIRLPDEKSGKAVALEVLPNSFLEAMEQDAARGIAQFIATYEVTAYRGRNFAIVRAYRRQIDNGNLRP